MANRRGNLTFLAAAAQAPGAMSSVQAPHHWQVREATLEADPVQHVSGDGDVWGETPITVRVLSRAGWFPPQAWAACSAGSASRAWTLAMRLPR
jgi:hypothetical protein